MKSLVVCSRGVRYVTASQPNEAKSRLFHSGLLAPEPQGLGPKRRAGISPPGSFIAAPQAIAGLQMLTSDGLADLDNRKCFARHAVHRTARGKEHSFHLPGQPAEPAEPREKRPLMGTDDNRTKGADTEHGSAAMPLAETLACARSTTDQSAFGGGDSADTRAGKQRSECACAAVLPPSAVAGGTVLGTHSIL